MPVADIRLDFTLPAELEAHEPPEVRGRGRDDVRLLVTYRDSDDTVHSHFPHLPDFLRPGDLVVVNDSGTLAAEVTAGHADGSTFPFRFSTQLDTDIWVVEPRDTTVEPGEILALPAGGNATILAPYLGSRRLWTARLRLSTLPVGYLSRHGRPIRYSYVTAEWPLEMYQTVYHGPLGSAEMPSAGRPFTREILDRLAQRGVDLARLTLHTGVASLEHDESPYPEAYRVPPETAEAVNRARQTGGRVIAVGTTVVRALETVSDPDGTVHVGAGWTDLVITPDRGVRAVDALLTGLHEPRSSHLAMLEAIAGREHLTHAYDAALAGRYLWHEFGDVHLIL